MFTAFAIGLCLTANVYLPGQIMAQVPGYVPTNGLVGYWPFNGNANDESGNGNNGTVNGATLTTDRFGVANKAYDFDGVNDFIEILHNSSLNFNSAYTLLGWYNLELIPTISEFALITKERNLNLTGIGINITNQSICDIFINNSVANNYCFNTPHTSGTWANIIMVHDGQMRKFYLNGVLVYSESFNNSPLASNLSLFIGKEFTSPNGGSVGTNRFFNGILDDIGIWNRALNDCEIQDLYNAHINSVAGSILTSTQSATVGSAVTLSSTTTSQSLQWQTNGVNLGWQNVPSNTTYSGGNTNTLTVNNVQLNNHNQPFRLIANVGNCSDTSNVTTIQIADTCITNVTVYDTLLTTVTDTLIINTTLSLPAPNNENTILIYPNPASDHITIDNGNFASMAGYSIKIENNAGQQVFQSAINQAQFYVDLSTWTGNGLYFVHLIDPQNNTVTVRKIVLQ